MTGSETPDLNVLVMEPEALSSHYVVQALELIHLHAHIGNVFSTNDDQELHKQFHLAILGFDKDPVENFFRLDQIRKYCPSAVVMGICPRISSTDRIALLNAGVDFIVEKPFFVEECASAISAVLRRLAPHLKSACSSNPRTSDFHEKH